MTTPAAIVITMDADLQNDPRDVPKLMAQIDEGYDIVSGWRRIAKTVLGPQVTFDDRQPHDFQCDGCAHP
ncbi:MAG: glycosyltransferase [Caldilineaceae bacterium]